jgi:hypothetical protein
MPDIERGQWVSVLPEHDIPPMFRPGGMPTTGRVESISGDTAMVCVPIGGANVDEHSQAVPYPVAALIPAGAPNAR